MSGSSSQAVVINFYEKVDPPSKFSTFVDGWANLGKFVLKLDYFIAAQLHRNIDPNGRFKYMNYATFDNTNDMVLKDMTEPSPELMQVLCDSHGPPGLQLYYPGGYHETKTNESPVAPDLPAKTDSCFLISAFKASVDISELTVEENIEKLTGLDIIIESAAASGGSFQVGEWALHRRFTPAAMFQPFDYVFRCELRGLGESFGPAQAVVEKLADAPTCDGVERSNTALYVVDSGHVTLPAAS